jgi:hypothetical protein
VAEKVITNGGEVQIFFSIICQPVREFDVGISLNMPRGRDLSQGN